MGGRGTGGKWPSAFGLLLLWGVAASALPLESGPTGQDSVVSAPAWFVSVILTTQSCMMCSVLWCVCVPRILQRPIQTPGPCLPSVLLAWVCQGLLSAGVCFGDRDCFQLSQRSTVFSAVRPVIRTSRALIYIHSYTLTRSNNSCPLVLHGVNFIISSNDLLSLFSIFEKVPRKSP